MNLSRAYRQGITKYTCFDGKGFLANNHWSIEEGSFSILKNATFRQLQIFVAAADRLSFARVAEDLHLTPAAVSFQIRQLARLTSLRGFGRSTEGRTYG